VRIDPAEGFPDGLCVDDEGCAWVAMWGGSQVLRFSPSGDLLARVRVPIVHTTACWFGGPDRDVLYITTSPGHRDPAEAEPDAGRLFQARIPGVTGPPGHEFAG
jgi:sugar lactone lactonase YvrE